MISGKPDSVFESPLEIKAVFDLAHNPVAVADRN